MGFKLKIAYFSIAVVLVVSILLIGGHSKDFGFNLRSFAFFMGDVSYELLGTEDKPILVVMVDINKVIGYGRYAVDIRSIEIYDSLGNKVEFIVTRIPQLITGRHTLILTAYPDGDRLYGEWYVKINIVDVDTNELVSVLILPFTVG